MTDKIENTEAIKPACAQEDEIDLPELAHVVWSGRKLIIVIVVCITLATIIASLLMTNIYTAEAVIKPVVQEKGGGRLSSLAAQFGGLASLAGIAMPGAASSAELVSLLKSNVLKKQVIEKYHLLPVLFPKKWDEEKKAWKKSGGFSFNPLVLISKLIPEKPGTPKKNKDIPDTWDGIRALDKTMKVNYNMKEDMITLTINFRDPAIAAAITNYFITELNERMSQEAKRIATINKEYLEQQLRETKDPLVQQKIYNLIADKIETTMMAEVKEGFAFKVLDPPMIPDRKSKPKRALMVVVAFMGSLFLSVFIVFVREYVKKIKARAAGGPDAI